jgi:hypothetical protein
VIAANEIVTKTFKAGDEGDRLKVVSKLFSLET